MALRMDPPLSEKEEYVFRWVLSRSGLARKARRRRPPPLLLHYCPRLLAAERTVLDCSLPLLAPPAARCRCMEFGAMLESLRTRDGVCDVGLGAITHTREREEAGIVVS